MLAERPTAASLRDMCPYMKSQKHAERHIILIILIILILILIVIILILIREAP